MDKSSFDIKECSVEMYPEFIDVIDTAFGYNSGWFLAELGHVLPPISTADYADTSKHLIAYNNGVIGAVGFYPMDIIATDGTESTVLKFGGVGQVSCLPERRGQGVMSGLMNAGIRRMRDAGIELSWLSGRRSRYAHFGYEIGGSQVEYSILATDIKQFECPGEGREYVASESDIETLDAIYHSMPSRIVRNNELWSRHIRRECLEWRIYEQNGKSAYIARYKFKDSGIWEAAGDGQCVLTLLARFLREYDKKHIMINYPVCHDDLSDCLYKYANHVSISPNGMLNVLDRRGVYQKILPFVRRQCAVRKDGDELIGIINNPDTAPIDAITSKMLGFLYGPYAERFEFLKPIAIYISKPDEV